MGAEWVPVRTCCRRFEATNRRFGTDWGRSRPAGACQIARLPSRFAIRQPLHIGQAQSSGAPSAVLAVVEKLVNALVAATAAVDEHVFQLHEPPKLTPQGSVAPAQRFTHLTLREAHVATRAWPAPDFAA